MLYEKRRNDLVTMKAKPHFFSVVCICACALGNALGVEIPIENHSFESITLADGTYTVNSIPGWIGEGSWYHVANPADSFFSGTTDGSGGVSPIDGYNAAAVNNYGHILYQNLTEVVQPNWTYTLTLLVGHRIGSPFDNGSVNLIAGNNILAQAFPNPPEDSFMRVTLEYNAPSAGNVIGQPLRIELKSAGPIAQAWFDDVHLDGQRSAPMPVPDTTSFGIGLVTLLATWGGVLGFHRKERSYKRTAQI